MYLKVPACVFILFPNKCACIYDNKQASKQIPWIDEFQNEKDIQLSLVNIMPYRYRAALLHWLSSVRSINSLVWVRAWVTRMFCLPGVVFFFLAKFPLSSDPVYEWAHMHLIILKGRNPATLYESISSYARNHLQLIQEEQVVSFWRKNMHLKMVNCHRRASTVTLWLSNRPSRYDLICLPWSFL